MNNSNNTLVSTVGGTFLSIAPQLLNCSVRFTDIINTTMLAAFGATVSFAVSVLLRHIVDKMRK